MWDVSCEKSRMPRRLFLRWAQHAMPWASRADTGFPTACDRVARSLPLPAAIGGPSA